MKTIKVLGVIAILFALMMSCNSDGSKWGTLQKLSHKPITGIYVAELAYQGGKAVTSGKNSTYENTQEFEITKEQFEEMGKLLGKQVTITYRDRGVVLVGPSKVIVSYDYDHDELTGKDNTSRIPN